MRTCWRWRRADGSRDYSIAEFTGECVQIGASSISLARAFFCVRRVTIVQDSKVQA